MLSPTARLRRSASIAAGIVVVAAVACGPKGGPGGPGTADSPAAGEYAGLRWVPPDATYAVVTRRTEDLILLLRDLADATGILSGEDAASIGAALDRELGFDPLALSDVVAQGIDPTRGVAIWSRGVSPSIAIPLADPPRFAAMIDERRSHGAVVQVARIGAVEVYTWRPDREVGFHWAIVDDWMIGHLALAEEHEEDEAWFHAAMAARGRFAAEADFAAARAEAVKRIGPSPGLVAVVRMPALFASRLGADMRPCRDTLGRLGRVVLGASSDGKDARAAVVAELPGGLDGIRAMQVAVPAGWAAARGDAPLQLEVGLDLRMLGPLWAACLDEDVAREAVAAGIYAGRAFAHEVDLDAMSGRGAVSVLGEAGAFSEMLDEIPGLDFLQKSRKVGAITIFDVNVPVVPRFSYALIDDHAVAAAGAPLDPIVGGGMVAPGDELGLFQVRPRVWPEERWDRLAAPLIGRDEERGRVVRSLRKWTLGRVAVGLDGRAVVIALHGVR